MILIADSGSTKTTWCFVADDNSTEFYSTNGLNPFFRTSENIFDELKETLVPKISGAVENIYFYGAGVVNAETGEVVAKALRKLFPGAKVETFSDLLAAARSTLQNERGIACIMGTGSNSCLYDGKKIIENVPPLGFILGDEGSGSAMGRKLLGDLFKGIMPGDVAEKFRQKFKLSYAEYLHKIYKEERPNRFLASLAPFLSENIKNEYCANLVEKSFEEFFNRNIFQYPTYKKERVCFVGSVAYYFSESLEKIMQNSEIRSGVILKEPIEGLIKFHSKK